MSGQSFQKQVVFLVDVNREQIDQNKQSLQEFVNTVCLTAFRLLSYFEDVGNSVVKSKPKHRQRSHLKWGFKFFNSRYHHSRIKQYSLKDFKLRYFEEFENEIERKFEIQEQNTEQKQCGSDCLRKTLIELIHDFQWQTPDITSPVKCRRGSKAKPVVENADLNKNLVFLFSFCPKNAAKLRQFSGKKVMDSSVFLDSFMPQSLRKEFAMCNLQLFWVDMTLCFPSSETEMDLKSITLTEDALEQLGGRLIQIESLVQLCHLATANSSSVDTWLGSDSQLGSKESDLLSKTRALDLNLSQTVGEVRPSNSKQNHCWKIPRAILPFSSVIESLLSRKNVFRTSGNPKLPIQELHDTSTNAIVHLMNDKKIYLKLQNSSKQCRDDNAQNDLFHISLGESSNIGRCSEGDDVLTIEKGKSVTSLCADDGVVHFCLCGVLSDDISLNLSFGTGDVFVCTSDAPDSSIDFYKLLLQLTVKKKSLVLQVKGNPCLFLMKSLTTVSATLCALTLGRTLKIEKALQQEQKGSQFTENSPSEVVTSDTGEQSWRKLLSKLHKDKFHVNSHRTVDKGRTKAMVCFDPKTVDKAYLPGCQPSLVSLVDKLNERISQLDFLTEGEVKALRQLQQSYRYEVHPPRPWDTRISSTASDPSKSTVVTAEQIPELDVDKSKLSKQDSKKGRGSVTSRGEMMVTRSRQTVKDVKNESDDKSVADTKQAPKPSVSSINIDFQDESELETYLKDLYEKTLDTDGNLVVCAQTIVMVSLHYMKEKTKDSPEEACDKFLRPVFIVPAAKLRDKYQAADDTTKLQKIREYQLQVILRLESQSIQLDGDTSLSEADGKLDEVVTMLRTLSFITEPAALSAFMKDTLVEHFVHTIPHTLGGIYDELMQPLPPALESILSPNHSADQSVFSQLSCDSTDPASNAPDISASQPASNKSDVLLNRSKHNTRKRSLVHHPSLAEVGPKRQIFVHVDTKAASKKRKLSSRNSTQSQPKKKQKVKGSAEKVCRNLFENDRKKLERHQSVTIMEGSSLKSRQRRKTLHSLKSPRGLKSPFKSPPFQFKNVIETPAHKQKSQTIFSRIEKERHRSKSVTNINIVEESPVKSAAEKYSPVQNKRAMALLRRSFYSTGPTNRSRNLTKSFQLADRIAGRSSSSSARLSLGSFLQDTSSEFKSPDKNNSSFMFSQLMGSPTPTKGTPRKTAITPAKIIMDSPCMNTRSQSPGRFEGTPRKGALGMVLSSPSMHTRSKSPGFAVSFQQALFRESPTLNRKSVDEIGVSGSGKKITTSKRTPLKNDMVNICESPSQNTRSKLTSTPSSTRRSVRAKMFLFRSPEHNTAPSFNKTDSISKSKCLNLTSFDEKTKDGPQIDGNCKQKVRHALVNLKWLEKDGGVGGIQIVDPDNKSQVPVSEQPNRTPPHRPSALQYSHETTSQETEKTPSPKPKLSVMKTPKSLNHWPRKKRACADSPTVKGASSLMQQQQKDNLKDSGDFEENEISCKSAKKEEQKNMRKESPCVSPVCETILSRQQVCVDDDNIISSQDRDDKTSTLLLTSSPNVKKRNLILSPDKETVFSPSKRRRISRTHSISEHQSQNLPVSYCLHRRILSQKVPSITSSQTSTGFDTDMIVSQNGAHVSNSQTSIGSLSQSSLESLEYFSLSNQEVFLCEKSKPALDQVRSNSPLLGSKSRFRSPVSEKNSSKLGNDASINETSSPFVLSSVADAPSKFSPPGKFSPSGRKYSPNVSAKSLMHLMNSPLMSGPIEDLTSPKIDKDSLNIQRQKTRGRSKRSLNLQI